MGKGGEEQKSNEKAYSDLLHFVTSLPKCILHKPVELSRELVEVCF